ncbi:hypothetical protein SCUCBS95973_008900 [Sporothrix curviconia]|uniref:Uncharacterized protein n=1 Tax=Sporothrix curviconia TaxID=1260050 RepID=A0ABP0CRX6_9PEZI
MEPVSATPQAPPVAQPPKAQPWKAFLSEPEVRPFVVEDKTTKTVLRLKAEKDEHGLGG